jgi:hypothetical protein
MLTFEYEEPSSQICECCGGVTTTLTRFIYEDGDAFGIYYARFSRTHPQQIVQAIVSLGDWGEGSGPWDRLAFPIEIRTAETEFQVGAVDAIDSPWQDVDIIGRILDRSEALGHDRIKDVWHVSDHMVADDPAIREYFEGAG